MNHNKSLMKSIPPPPSFSSAPNIHSDIPIPSFSSAPDFSVSPTVKLEERLEEKRESRRERSPESHRHRHRRDHRSRSPSYRSSRLRSRSPSHKSSSSRYRSRSPSHKTSSRHRSRSPHSRSSRRQERSHHHRRSKRTPSPEAVHTGTLSTGITFVIDKRGDADNLTYGSNHAYTIPSYKRKGGGRIIGLPPSKRIDHHAVTKSGQIKLTDQHTHKGTRYTDADYSWKELDKSLKRIHIQPQKQSTDPFASNSTLIPLDSQQPIATHSDDSLYISSGVDYRSLEGNKVKREVIDEENQDDEEEGESFNDRMRQRTIHYNRQLDQEPTNVKLWLEFIDFQDEAAAGLGISSSKKSSLNEVKLSIYEKALQHNPTDESLILAYLKCGAETWETLHLLRQWDKMLKQYPDSIQLWAEYINTRQTNFASFTYSQCVQVFEDALSTLTRHLKRRKSHEELEDMEALMVYVLLRACLFMKQAGYQERAIAAMQAVVEFNFFQPRILDGDERKVQVFGDFWDSEVLRFGEEGARGWHEFYRAQDVGEEIEELPTIARGKEEDEDEILTLEDWISSEHKSEQKDRLPFRMSQAEDDSVDEDPYRIILSDDIKSFLFNITTEDARQSLIYSIFVFLGLPYMPPNVGTNTHFCTDTFTHNDLALTHFWPKKDDASMKHLVWYVEGVPMNPEQATAQNKPYYIPNSYPVGLSELFARSGDWFKCSGKEFIHCNVDEQFTRNIFRQLLTVDRSEHLIICYLAFESSCGYKPGRKLAKSLLKDQRTSLTLWNAYAQMEQSHGRVDEARKVYLTALSMYHTFPEKDQPSVPLLYYMFAKLEMDNNKPNEALKILVSMSGTQPYDEKTQMPTTPSILRTREHFSQKLAQLSTLSDSSIERQAALHTIGCCALFEYLSSGLDSACLIYERALGYIRERQAERGYESEMIWADYASLLYRDASSTMNSGYKPGMLRQTMERALALFPNNTMFLSFYIWNESKTKIYNRVQHLLNDILNKDSNVILWLSAIYSELHRYKPFQVNSVRDFFERSIRDTRTRSSIILWKYYIQFEVLQNNLDRARNLFYRSIRECPWSKELYLLGIQTFSKAMNEKEANELVSLMMEKEIRLRIPIEEDLLA